MIERKLEAFYDKNEKWLRQHNLEMVFASVIEPRAFTFVAKKVAKLSGDIRVAFDLIKAGFSLLAKELASSDTLPDESHIKVSLDHVLKVFEARFGSKLGEMLKNQPMTNLLLLNAAVDLFEGD